MIAYHGLPITPETAALRAISGGHAMISFAYPEQLPLAISEASSWCLDNGAFTAWKGGGSPEWDRFYAWVAHLHRMPGFDFAVIPDVIDGDEKANDDLLSQWPWTGTMSWVGAPVWHLQESLERLDLLASNWPRICLGSSGAFSQPETIRWWGRIAEAMHVLCDREGRPGVKIHGLRMLDADICAKVPLASADSTNIARNIGIDSAWRGTYQPATKEARAAAMRERIESVRSPSFWDRAIVGRQFMLAGM